MCGRFKLAATSRFVAEHFDLAEVPFLEPRYNVAPGQTVLVVRPSSGARQLAALHWGLVPSWAKDVKIGYRLLNARCETVEEKPAFRAAFRKRRCLIPADGFFEWQKTGRKKQPFLFQVNDGLFAFAGLWEHWQNSDGETLESCTILTTEANELVRPLHDRMPVIVAPADYASWLEPQVVAEEEVDRLFRPFAATAMTAMAVNPWVNDARHEGPLCIEPVVDRSLF